MMAANHRLVSCLVCIDDDCLVTPAYIDPTESWNGFLEPYFTRSTAERLDLWFLRWEEDRLFVTMDPDDKEWEADMARVEVDGQLVWVYKCTDGWAWMDTSD